MQQSDLTRFLANAQRVRVINHYLWQTSRKLEQHYAAPSAYDFLADVLQSQPLLLNVQVVQCSIIDIQDNTYIFLRSVHVLFGPRLRTLSLSFVGYAPSKLFPLSPPPQLLDNVDSEDEIVCILSKVKQLVPGLQNIHLFLEPSSHIVKAVSSMICGLNNLTSVHLNSSSDKFPLTPQVFVYLALLPDLRTLQVSSDRVFWRQGEFGPLPYTLRGRTFPALRRFIVKTPTLHLPVQLLQFVTSPHLVQIYVTTTSMVLRRDIRPFFAAIATHPSRKTLHTLWVEVRSVVRSDGRTYVAPSPICEKTLAPLWGLPMIQDLVLDIHCPFDVDDALLRKIGTTWVCIESLHLGVQSPWGTGEQDAPVEGYPGADSGSPITPALELEDDAEAEVEEDGEEDEDEEDGDDGSVMDEDDENSEDEDDIDMDDMPCGWRRPRATLSGLAEFISSCHLLRNLGVAFSADASSFSPDKPTTRPNAASGRPNRRQTLTGLSPGLSPIDDPFAVAAFLSNVCDKIGYVEIEPCTAGKGLIRKHRYTTDI